MYMYIAVGMDGWMDGEFDLEPGKGRGGEGWGCSRFREGWGCCMLKGVGGAGKG